MVGWDVPNLTTSRHHALIQTIERDWWTQSPTWANWTRVETESSRKLSIEIEKWIDALTVTTIDHQMKRRQSPWHHHRKRSGSVIIWLVMWSSPSQIEFFIASISIPPTMILAHPWYAWNMWHKSLWLGNQTQVLWTETEKSSSLHKLRSINSINILYSDENKRTERKKAKKISATLHNVSRCFPLLLHTSAARRRETKLLLFTQLQWIVLLWIAM